MKSRDDRIRRYAENSVAFDDAFLGRHYGEDVCYLLSRLETERKEGRASAFREAVEIARRAFYGASGSEKGSEYCYDIDIADAIEAAAKDKED